jgi:hypothetical protein
MPLFPRIASLLVRELMRQLAKRLLDRQQEIEFDWWSGPDE